MKQKTNFLHFNSRYCHYFQKTANVLFKNTQMYRGADKSLARPTSRFILFNGQNISFDASLVVYINSTNIPPIMIINGIYKTQNLLSLQLVSFLVGLRTYQHPCSYTHSQPHLSTSTYFSRQKKTFIEYLTSSRIPSYQDI